MSIVAMVIVNPMCSHFVLDCASQGIVAHVVGRISSLFV
jgi:hypothetical protein